MTGMSDPAGKNKKRPFFLSKNIRGNSDNSGRSGNKEAKKAGHANRSEDSDSGSEVELDKNFVPRDPAMPSFRTRRERKGNSHLIEDDAMRTIRDTSGTYDDERQLDSGDEDMEQKYQDKIARFGRRDSSSSRSNNSYTSGERKNVRFNNSTIEYDDDDEKSHSLGQNEREGQEEEGDNESVKTSESGGLDHFKNFFNRSGSQARRERSQSGMRSLRGDEEEEDDGFMSKFMNSLSRGGGLAPGFPNSESKESDHRDVERDAGQDGIALTDFSDEAQKIVQQHSLLNPNQQKAAGELADREAFTDRSSEGETLGDSSHDNSSFVAPPMENYAFNMGSDGEETDDYDPFIEDTAYVAPPARVRGGVLGSLLKLYQNEDPSMTQSQLSLDESVKGHSDTGENFYSEPSTARSSRLKLPQSATNLKKLKNIPKNIEKSIPKKMPMGIPYRNKSSADVNETDSELPTFKNTRPKAKKSKMPKFKKRMAAEAKITVHIADLLQRHRFILRMCKALMLYGAPTHRLEEYMVMTSRVLEIDGQFLYLPGCMIVSFGDATTRTSEVQLVRVAQGLNLWKLHQVHTIYKKVIHDTMSAAEGNLIIDKILQDPNLYPPWVCVLLYGFCSSMVTPFAFNGGWINLAISFFMGSCVGCLQYIVSQRSNMYSNVFEVSASIVVSFCGRAFGSIPRSGICFGAVAQGSLALILPGYIILCGSLELQSRNLVAGSVRMFYAIIYSLFLGFGITLGAALFGWMYDNATNDASCASLISPLFRILFVPAFTIGISLINQAHWIQLPVMALISCTGYVVTYFAGEHFQNSTEFTAALAAFVIGLMGNLYSRIWQGLAVSAMLPAIFVQVPSGVASQSSLLAGIESANQLTHHNSSTATDTSSSMAFGVTMVQVSIGITVGLFASSLFIYPFGKKKTGLFSL